MAHDAPDSFSQWFIVFTNIVIGFNLEPEAAGLFFPLEKMASPTLLFWVFPSQTFTNPLLCEVSF
jgi:hypothetical protein